MGDIQSRLQPGFQRAALDAATVPTVEQIAEARAALRVKFLVLAPRRVAALRDMLVAAEMDDEARRELQRLGHQLRGTAATVGLLDLGLLGGVIEHAAAAAPFTEGDHARAAAAVALAEEYVTSARADLDVGAMADDPRFKALVPESP